MATLDTLKITSINVLRAGASVVSVVAESNIQLEFTFNRDLVASDNAVIRCRLHDPVFYLDYYLRDIPVTASSKRLGSSPLPALPANKLSKSVTFPEELAGASIIMSFFMKIDIKSISEHDMAKNSLLTYMSSPISKPLNITSSVTGAPKIEAVYWGVNEKIEYRKTSTKRTGTIHRNETGFLHIHTRGLYGKEVEIGAFFWDSTTSPAIPITGARNFGKVRIKNNIAVKVFQIWFFHSRLSLPESTNAIAAQAKYGTAIEKSSKLTFNLTSNAPIVIKSTKVLATPGGKAEPQLRTKATCRVEFRPGRTYKGDFGFSWYRKGDLAGYGVNPTASPYSRTNEVVQRNVPCNDHAFEKIMGRHYTTASPPVTTPPTPRKTGAVVQNGNDSSHFFDLDPVMAENHKFDFRRLILASFPVNVRYYIPVMTLRKGEKAELSLFIEAREPVDKIDFCFDNKKAIDDGYLKITPNVINRIPKRSYSLWTSTIEVECLKEFSTELLLQAKAYSAPKRGAITVLPELIGAVKLLPNDILHQRRLKVVFFNVKTKLNPPAVNEGFAPGTTINQRNMRKFLGQAFVVPEISVVQLDLTTETSDLYTDSIHTVGGIKIFNASETSKLEKFLITKVPAIYDGHYKIFFIGNRCGYATGGGLNGFSSGSREKFTVNFFSATPETPTHELGHALGLPHTFDGSTTGAKYVYKDGKTNNVMDYSHQIGIKRTSFFHWQWKAMNNMLS